MAWGSDLAQRWQPRQQRFRRVAHVLLSDAIWLLVEGMESLSTMRDLQAQMEQADDRWQSVIERLLEKS